MPIWHGTFVLGADRAADVQVAWPGVRPQHLRFVPVEGMVRVEPVAAGATIEVNGEQLFSKDLRDGDVITIGALQIRWVDAQARPLAPVRAASPARAAVQAANTMPSGGRAGVAPPSAASRSARKGGRSAKGAAKEDPRERARSERSGRRSGASSWGIVSAAVMVVMLLGYGLLQHFKNSTWPSSPQHYVDLAREQLGNRQPERALATLAFALKDATGAVRVQAEQLTPTFGSCYWRPRRCRRCWWRAPKATSCVSSPHAT